MFDHINNTALVAPNEDKEEIIEPSSSYSKYTKDNIFCALEELRLRRKTEAENAAKISNLIKEKYEVCRKKDDILCQSEITISSLKQQNEEISGKLATAVHKLEEFEARKLTNEEFDKQGLKSLKDDVIAQQLARHGLEERLKEQDCRFGLQMKAEENLNKRIKDLEERLHVIEKERGILQNEILIIESNAQKASLFQNKIMRINKHQKCDLEMYQEKTARALIELAKAKAASHNEENDKKSNISHNNTKRKQQDTKQDMLTHQLEDLAASLKKEKYELLELLSKQSSQVNEMSKSLSALSASEMALHFEIDDLQAEVKRFSKKASEEYQAASQSDGIADNDCESWHSKQDSNKLETSDCSKEKVNSAIAEDRDFATIVSQSS